MARLALAALLLAAALAGPVSANLNDDRIAARTACYKECLTSDGWDPVCVWNPKYPNRTTHGGGEFVYPNECTAKCMQKWGKYSETKSLVVKRRVAMRDHFYQKVWEIYFGDISDPICYQCPSKAAPKPAFKAIPEEQCNIACADRDGWKPICVRDFTSGKKFAFGNACVARCSSQIFSPTPLYYTSLPSACKPLFEFGKVAPDCMKCKAGAIRDDLDIPDDRVAALEYCYKACVSLYGFNPVCMWNPAYPKPTTHGGGSSVWPNKCTGECMSQYAKYAECFNLVVKKKVTKPQTCKDRLYDIWYFTSSPPSAPQSLIDKCTSC
ncbi:hypothetical protein ABPG75_008840 [Micractinium tetrahymenae]